MHAQPSLALSSKMLWEPWHPGPWAPGTYALDESTVTEIKKRLAITFSGIENHNILKESRFNQVFFFKKKYSYICLDFPLSMIFFKFIVFLDEAVKHILTD